MKTRQINFLYNEPKEEEIEKPKKKRNPGFFVIIAIILVFFVGCTINYLKPVELPDDPSAYDPTTLEPKKPAGFFNKISNYVFQKEYKLDGEKEDRINILLLGMGGVGHDGPFLTDTIIIASIKPSTNEIAMISIPRDLGAQIPDYGWYKINHANAFGEVKDRGNGAELAIDVVENTFDIDINYYTRIDFTAFAEIIEAVGGVDIYVDNTFTDNSYPDQNDGYQTVHFDSGWQTMDGQTALQFSRSRHGDNGEGSDFSRARRQQKIILALKEKLLSVSTLANPIKIAKIYQSLNTHIDTDMEFGDIISFLKMIKDLKLNNIKTEVLDDSPNGFLQNSITDQGAFILSPKTGNFSEINQMIKNIFEIKDNSTTKLSDNSIPQLNKDENNTDNETYSDNKVQPTDNTTSTDTEKQIINIEIQNGTWIAGLASRTKKDLLDNLTDESISIPYIGNTDEKPTKNSLIFVNGDRDLSDTVDEIKNILDVTTTNKLPTNINFYEDTDILIILGSNFKEI